MREISFEEFFEINLYKKFESIDIEDILESKKLQDNVFSENLIKFF